MRRIDVTFRLLADAAVAQVPARQAPHRSGQGWVVEKLRTLVRLDKHTGWS
jgi:hypothetical protein